MCAAHSVYGDKDEVVHDMSGGLQGGAGREGWTEGLILPWSTNGAILCLPPTDSDGCVLARKRSQ